MIFSSIFLPLLVQRLMREINQILSLQMRDLGKAIGKICLEMKRKTMEWPPGPTVYMLKCREVGT